MELSVHDRLLLLNLLPKEGDLTSIRIVRQLRESLSFSEEDHKTLHMEQFEDEQTHQMMLRWNQEFPAKEVSIGPKAQLLIGDQLKALDSAKKLTEEFLSLYDRFVVEG